METISVPADTAALALRLVLATILGAAVGLNREMSLKPAGLRTHALVSLGAALLTYVGLQLGRPAGDMDPASRVVQGMVAGIGFIGGGVILHRGTGTVQGLTTAASIWVVAATGAAAGAGLWRAATISILLTLAVLTIGHTVDNALHKTSGPDRD